MKMKYCLLAVTLLLGNWQLVLAEPRPFGTASDYNKFILGDVVHYGGDSEGPVAIAGDAELTSYGIADRTSGVDIGLVVGGELKQTNGQTFAGDVHVGGKVKKISTIANGSLYNPSTPIDFDAEATYLRALSDFWQQLPTNGSLNLQSWGALELTGTDSNLNVFSIDKLTWEGSSEIRLSAPSSATIIINVEDDQDTIPSDHSWFGSMFFNNSTSASDWQKVIWNFPNMTEFSISNVGWKGTLFAPNANFTYASGNVEGHLIVKSVSASQWSAETHWYPFTGDAPVPQDEEETDSDDTNNTEQDSNPNSTNAALTDGSFQKATSYNIELVSQDGTTWVYDISKVTGHDLSHWVLGFACSSAQVVSSTPSNDGIQVDPSIENMGGPSFYGIKWNSTGGRFTIVLDQAYEATTLDLMVKAATGYGAGSITGPDCNSPVSGDSSNDDSDDANEPEESGSDNANEPEEETGSDDANESEETGSDDANEPEEETGSDDANEPEESGSDDTNEPEESGSDDANEPEEETGSDDANEPEEETGSDDANEPEEETGSDDTSEPEDNTPQHACDVTAGDSVTLTAGGSDKSSTNKPTDYTITFEGVRSGISWVYSVYREVGSDKRALSHWSLGMSNCNVVSKTGAGSEVGNGGSETADGALAGQPLIKWNTDVSTDPNNPTIFTFTLDGEYTAKQAVVVAKTGGDFKLDDGMIIAPDCDNPMPSSCNVVDTDNDSIPDESDNCPNAANMNQEDADHDGIGDACDSTPNPVDEPTDSPKWADGFSGEFVAWSEMGGGSGTSYFGETLYTNDSICTLAQAGVLEKPWYEPQWIKARGRIVLFSEQDGQWVQGGALKMKLSLGWYIVHPKNSRNLTGETIICPTVMPDGVALPVECADGPDDKYEDGHYLTSREVLTSDENGVIEFETYGWWTGVPEGYRDALDLITQDGSPDWTGRTEYIVENHYGGTLRGGDDSEYLLANLDFDGTLRGIGRDVAWNAAWSQAGCDLPETDDSTDDETDDGALDEGDDADESTDDDSADNGGNVACPDGSDMLAKFEWNGSRYVLDGSNEGGIILRGTSIETIANATAGKWTAAVPMAYLVLKGATDSYIYELQGATEGAFSKEVLEGNGDSPDISNMKFCGDPDAPKNFDDLAVEGVESITSTRIWTLPESELVCDNDCDPALLQHFSDEGNTINILNQADLLLELEVSDAKGLPIRYEYMYLDIGQ